MAGTAVAESVPAPVQRRGERRKRASTRWGPDDADVEPVAPDAAEPAVTVPGEQPAPASAAEARPRKRPKRTRWVADDAPDPEVGCLTGHVERACLRCVPAEAPVAGGPCESASAVPAVSRRRCMAELLHRWGQLQPSSCAMTVSWSGMPLRDVLLRTGCQRE